ncbi:PLP-dependent transferase [Lindgomyces ingoldianus]|uniref:PLP-dependent transferase n=1 Tax=Lindgomyces ingoldianus TaxID=673940 RepID=A0ACB6R1D5_9PLEO|nr:PLP-dependent transferase [Lindgomyces ingoldianus]KAF2472996.1 PLP-dependent transferase [Lindgomyces ingoldianus]
MTLTTLAVRDKSEGDLKFGKELRKQFLFDPKYLNLNHGSFGTYPNTVRAAMRSFQDQAESRPDEFIRYTYPKLLDQSRSAISTILSAPVETLVFVPNATTGINTVLRNLAFEPGEKIIYFATIYGACEKTVTYITETTPAESVKIEYTYPVEDDWLVDEFKRKVAAEKSQGCRVKVAIFDTVVSMPGVRMPFEKLTEACRELGVLSCVDAAHGVGHVELDLAKLDPDFLVSNCHKWLFVPRGCAIFYVPLRNQPLLPSTLPTSHGFIPKPKPGVTIHSPLPKSSKSSFVTNFEFVGTIDNAPYLCIPDALKFRSSIGGERKIISYNHTLAKSAASHVAEVLGTEVLENATGTLSNCCLSNVRLPLALLSIEKIAVENGVQKASVGNFVRDWMSKAVIDDYDTFMAFMFYGGNWWVRFSAQVYLEMSDFAWAAERLKGLCQRVEKGEFLGVKSRL